MIEKIILAMAISFSLYSIVQIKPPQRAVSIEMNFPQEIFYERPAEVTVAEQT
jgi:hypothetical protein